MNDTLAWMRANEIPLDQVPDEVREYRLATCKNCPTNEFRKLTKQCRNCGCFMEVKARLIYDPVESVKQQQLSKAVCPSGHWPGYVEPNI